MADMQQERATSVIIGGRAEQVAADYLASLGYEILARNWRKRECEIDIVASKAEAVSFVEVKHRSTNIAGSGLEYIGPQKLRQMEYAAQRWVAENRWDGEYMLAAIEISGASYDVTAFIDCIY